MTAPRDTATPLGALVDAVAHHLTVLYGWSDATATASDVRDSMRRLDAALLEARDVQLLAAETAKGEPVPSEDQRRAEVCDACPYCMAAEAVTESDDQEEEVPGEWR